MTVRPPEGAITVRHTRLAPDTQQRRAVGPRPSLSRPSVKRTGSSAWCRGQAARASGSHHLFSNPGSTIQRLRGLGKVTQTLLAQCSGLQRWDNQHPTLKTKTKTKHPAGERAGGAAGGAPCAGTPPQARLPRPLSPSHAPLPPPCSRCPQSPLGPHAALGSCIRLPRYTASDREPRGFKQRASSSHGFCGQEPARGGWSSAGPRQVPAAASRLQARGGHVQVRGVLAELGPFRL